MSLSPGARIGVYEITGKLGEGGMGEVYRARDTKLNRVVAIKSLQAAVAGDQERVARFEREAQLLASLNHPNIGAIHGLQESNGSTYLVLEFVDGKPLDVVLRERAFRGSKEPGLPLDEALPIAKQIADAVAAAHEKGIIHRDLKPGNVMITGEGQVKVLDFGLGKSIAAEHPSGASEANSPTITVGATQAGIILGTAAYMSPEQAKGKPVDRRSDVWSFGCVLFEMLAGRRAFQGEDVSDTLASVLKESPDFSTLPSNLPPAVRLVIERCLTKDRGARLSDMSTARFLLTEPSVVSSMARETPAPTRPGAPAGRRLAFGTALGLVAVSVVTTAALVWALLPRANANADGPSATAVHVSLPLPSGELFTNPDMLPFAVSPDGQRVVYASGSGKSRLYVRDLASSTASEIAGTDGAVFPSFSPNGQWVGFIAQNKLKKASIGGGSVDTLTTVGNARGTTWSEDGYIYYAQANIGAISRVSESGGAPTEVTRVDAASGEISHRNPQVLPGGKAILFTIWKGPGPDEKFVAVQSISDGAGTHRILVRGGTDGQFVSSGHLTYARSDQLFAVPFDLATLDIAKTAPVQLHERIIGESVEHSAFTVSGAGTLAYLPATPARFERRLIWQDASGSVQPLPLPNRMYEQVTLSPDGASAIVQIIDGSVGLWRLDLSQMTLTPLATTGGSSQAAVWTEDSRRVIYRATRNGIRNLFWKAADGTGEEERLATKAGYIQTASSVSPDGEWVLFNEGGAQRDRGLYRLRLRGSKEVVPITTQMQEANPMLSPNGKWLAYEELTGVEIYVRAYPDLGPRILVTRNGGIEPCWSHDGTKLYFRRGDELWVADVSTSGTTFSAGTPRLLINGGFIPSANGVTAYSVAKDGRFLRVQSIAPEPPANTINLVLNWGAELARLVK